MFEGFAAGSRRGIDATALAELHRAHAAEVDAWARANVSHALRRDVDPEDVAQEVWVRAARARHRYDASRGCPRAWLFRVAADTLLDVCRHHGTALETPDAGDDAAGPDREAWRAAAGREGLEVLARHLEHIDGFDRELFVLCALDELLPREAAVRLGRSYEAVRKRWYRLRRRLVELEGGLDPRV